MIVTLVRRGVWGESCVRAGRHAIKNAIANPNSVQTVGISDTIYPEVFISSEKSFASMLIVPLGGHMLRLK